MTDRLGIEALSVFGLAPVEFVDLAADLGCRYISLFLRTLTSEPLGYPRFSLVDDVALRRNVRAALAHHGITVSLGDGFMVLPGADMDELCGDLDVLAELGVPRINVVSLDPDRSRTFDQFARLAELAGQRELRTMIEPVPGLTVGDLPTAVAAVEHIGRPDVRLLIDTMHLVRSGAGADDLDARLIGYAQLSDTTLGAAGPGYAEEALYERLIPGRGELPLAEIIAALPADIVIGLEVPQRTSALHGVGHRERLRPCVEAARVLLGTRGDLTSAAAQPARPTTTG